MWLQKEIRLQAKPRGFHLITDELLRELPELRDCKIGMIGMIGMMNIFIMHTSASLTLNENADPTVRQDSRVTSIARCRRTSLTTAIGTKVRTIFPRISNPVCSARA